MRSTVDRMEPPSPGCCPCRRPSTTSACTEPTLLDVLLANPSGGVVGLGHRCMGFEEDDEHAAVVFATGTRVTADVVVGATGIHSTLQPHVAAVPEPIHSGSTAYRGVITTESVR
jgi:salicylate hydroxylase